MLTSGNQRTADTKHQCHQTRLSRSCDCVSCWRTPVIVTTQIADLRCANGGILHWANVDNIRCANVILLVGPTLAQRAFGQRWQIIIQHCVNIGFVLGQRKLLMCSMCFCVGPKLAQCWTNVNLMCVCGFYVRPTLA